MKSNVHKLTFEKSDKRHDLLTRSYIKKCCSLEIIYWLPRGVIQSYSESVNVTKNLYSNYTRSGCGLYQKLLELSLEKTLHSCWMSGSKCVIAQPSKGWITLT